MNDLENNQIGESTLQGESPTQTFFHQHNGVDSSRIDKKANNIPDMVIKPNTPTNTNTVPVRLGDVYIDTLNRKVYVATLLSNPPAFGDYSILN